MMAKTWSPTHSLIRSAPKSSSTRHSLDRTQNLCYSASSEAIPYVHQDVRNTGKDHGNTPLHLLLRHYRRQKRLACPCSPVKHRALIGVFDNRHSVLSPLRNDIVVKALPIVRLRNAAGLDETGQPVLFTPDSLLFAHLHSTVEQSRRCGADHLEVTLGILPKISGAVPAQFPLVLDSHNLCHVTLQFLRQEPVIRPSATSVAFQRLHSLRQARMLSLNSSRMFAIDSMSRIRVPPVIIVFARYDVLIFAWVQQEIQIHHPAHAVLAT